MPFAPGAWQTFLRPWMGLHQHAHHIKSSSDDLVTLSNAGGGGVGARLRPRRPLLAKIPVAPVGQESASDIPYPYLIGLEQHILH